MSEPEFRPVNLDAVEAYDKNVLEPAFVVHWSGYTAEPTARVRAPWAELSKQSINMEKASYANLHEMPNSDDYALKPSDEKGSNSLQIRWNAEDAFRINLRKVLKLADVSVTKGYKLIIPVEFLELPKLGSCMVLRLTQRRLEKITPKKKNDAAQGSPDGTKSKEQKDG